ncbi:F-box/LRR-repeat protein 7 [Phtheirospermum japonicum]|uniref:F-box/LRR-repeat protein 7 n=1 Tax=Phtheirospermum japonicum TaxID=374723 RepID=A0A830CR37_9LAMI|nr:F-box/LRR-repeat protein 7 [Phtheirospermum japonicum]
MKRESEIVDLDSENSGSKKVRFSNGNDEICGDLDRNENEEKRVCGKVDKNGGTVGDLVSDDFQGPSLGGLNKSNNWDFDLNSDLNFGNEEEQKGLVFNLNLPAISKKSVDVINIESDGSGDEVEVVGYTCGYNNAKGKQIELGMPNDRLDHLSLGLGMIGMYNIVGESSLDGMRRFTREEKGKANVVDDSWLSLRAQSPPIGLHLLIDSDDDDDDLIGLGEPEFPVGAEMAERAFRQADEAFRFRHNLFQESWKETAKRFARTNFQEDQSNVKEPSSQKQELGNCPGPFSDSLRMVRERASKRGAAAWQLIDWKPAKENEDISATARFVPSLLDLSLKALAENAEWIVSLELVPDNLRERLVGRSEEAVNVSLDVLQLDLCGQCMLDFAFKDVLSNSSFSFSSLAIVSLRGACRLSDSGLKDLIISAPSLQSINLGHCSLLTANAVNLIADFLGSNLRELFIDDCQKINPMLILTAFKKFTCLEVLSVAGIHSITDQFINEMVTVCGRNIKELDLADCIKLTDCCLKTIGSNCADLRSLNISNLPNLTDLGMEYIANGCRSIRKFKLCRNEFSDEAMAAYIESSGESLTELLLNHMTKAGPNVALSLAKRSRKLLSLDISWCRKITNEALGLIVDSCLSLKLLKVFGCRQITNVFLNGHSNPDVRIIGLNLTPILDHANLLEPEGVLLRYSPLPTSQ